MKGLVGLQGSSVGSGDDNSSLKAFLAAATCCSVFFAVFFRETAMLGFRLVIDLGDSKEEGSSLDLDLEEVVLEALF